MNKKDMIEAFESWIDDTYFAHFPIIGFKVDKMFINRKDKYEIASGEVVLLIPDNIVRFDIEVDGNIKGCRGQASYLSENGKWKPASIDGYQLRWMVEK